MNNIEYFLPNFEGLVLGSIDADFYAQIVLILFFIWQFLKKIGKLKPLQNFLKLQIANCIGVDTAENEHCDVCPLSVERSLRCNWFVLGHFVEWCVAEFPCCAFAPSKELKKVPLYAVPSIPDRWRALNGGRPPQRDRSRGRAERSRLFHHQNPHLTFFFLHQERDLVELCIMIVG